MAESVPNRRWFQFSLAECLILTTLLCVVWWQASTRSVTLYNQNGVTKDKHGVVTGSWHADAMHLNRPPLDIAIKRGCIWSAEVIGVCLISSIALRAALRRRPAQSEGGAQDRSPGQ